MSLDANPLTLDEHRDLGREIAKSRAAMRQLSEMVAAVYGAHSSPAVRFEIVNEAMAKLIAEMQAQADADCPGQNAASLYR